MTSRKRVLVAMSGGVDSALAAALLIEGGYEVSAITLKLFKGQAEQIVRDAQSICQHLKIPHEVLDLQKEFYEHVIGPFIKGYQAGLTPNPCAFCNPNIKFGALFQHMKDEGYDYLATGHYAGIEIEKGIRRLKKSPAERKDQAYFLHGLSAAQLEYILFPLGQFSGKDQIRQEAQVRGISVAQKKDSDGICFIQGETHTEWLSRHIGDQVSYNIVTGQGQVLGTTREGIGFTLGQKRNLGVDLPKDWCVLSIDARNRRILVGPEHRAYGRSLVAKNLAWIQGDELLREAFPLRVQAKIFNWGYVLLGHLQPLEQGRWLVTFDEPVRAIAPGQHIVFYDDLWVLGGAEIEKVLPEPDYQG